MEESLYDLPVSELQTQLGTWLEQRTGGLVRNARVEVIEGRLIVHGYTESEHIREVATLALAVLLGAIRAHRLEIGSNALKWCSRPMITVTARRCLMKCPATKLATADLNSRLEQWIEQRTGGRVHCLRVEQAGERLIVSGHTGSYHVRQLVLAAVMDVLDPKLLDQMELDIDVRNGSSRPVPYPVPRISPSWFPVDAAPQRAMPAGGQLAAFPQESCVGTPPVAFPVPDSPAI